MSDKTQTSALPQVQRSKHKTFYATKNANGNYPVIHTAYSTIVCTVSPEGENCMCEALLIDGEEFLELAQFVQSLINLKN